MSNHGGKREGAGRPFVNEDLKRNTMPVRIPQWLISVIDSLDGSRGKVVEEAVIKAHKLKPPKIEE